MVTLAGAFLKQSALPPRTPRLMWGFGWTPGKGRGGQRLGEGCRGAHGGQNAVAGRRRPDPEPTRR